MDNKTLDSCMIYIWTLRDLLNSKASERIVKGIQGRKKYPSIDFLNTCLKLLSEREQKISSLRYGKDDGVVKCIFAMLKELDYLNIRAPKIPKEVKEELDNSPF